MIAHKLVAVPQGLIESGSVSIQVDELTGLIDFQATVVAGIGWFAKTESAADEVKIDPSLLLSKNIKVGMKWIIGSVIISIDSIAKGVGQVSVSVQDSTKSLHGNAQVDLSHDHVSIQHVLIEGMVSGAKVVLELVPA